VPVCLVSVRGSAVRVRQGVFSVFFVEVPTQLVLENHENTISCQGKLDRKIITFSPTYQLIKIVVKKNVK
jgi:hypothetical protein